MKRQKIEKHYRLRAREVVDVLHDKGYISSGVTREMMRVFQEYLAFIFQSNSESSVRASKLLDSLNKRL